jgi:hypothetical protein
MLNTDLPIIRAGERTSLQDRLQSDDPKPWLLSRSLFGDTGAGDIWDFMLENYFFFLENMKSWRDLIDGLEQLSPLADDALEVAETMSNQDFYVFKITLARASQEFVQIPLEYVAILTPNIFSLACPVTEKMAVTLGCAAIRIMELNLHVQA